MIDFEFSCVSFAVKDMGWALDLWLKGISNRRAFFKKYLECMGDDTSDEYVDEVILEAEYFSICCSLFNMVAMQEIHNSDNPRYDFMFFRRIKELVEESKTN